MPPVVILGWDALDLEHIKRLGLGTKFGAHRAKIGTYVNPKIGEPHTQELWPSLITGLPPDEHGVHAVSQASGGVDWDSRWLRLGSYVADYTMPDRIQTWLGAVLRGHGAELNSKTPAYYQRNDIPTVFDEGGRAISIPNYETDRDHTHGLDADRTSLWTALHADKTGHGVRPRVDEAHVYNILGGAMGRRVGETLQAIHAGHSLVWTWFGLLDSIGHIEPALGRGIVDNWYHVAAAATSMIREQAPDDTIVVAVSDHGIDHGDHTHYATICSDTAAPVKAIDHVFDVADWVTATKDAGSPSVTQSATVTTDGMEQVSAQLEALGYR